MPNRPTPCDAINKDAQRGRRLRVTDCFADWVDLPFGLTFIGAVDGMSNCWVMVVGRVQKSPPSLADDRRFGVARRKSTVTNAVYSDKSSDKTHLLAQLGDKIRDEPSIDPEIDQEFVANSTGSAVKKQLGN